LTPDRTVSNAEVCPDCLGAGERQTFWRVDLTCGYTTLPCASCAGTGRRVLDWHAVTSAEEAGVGYEYILDVSPDWVPDQACEFLGALVRTGQPGWAWWVRSVGVRNKKGSEDNLFLNETGTALTKEEALAAGCACLRRHREKVGS